MDQNDLSDLLSWVNATSFLAAETSMLAHAEHDARYTLITNYVAFVGFSILVWDHLITFSDEVHYIWSKLSRPTSVLQKPLVILFLFNRYFTPFAFILNLTAYLSSWSLTTCSHFVRYEGACTAIALAVSELLLLIRIIGLYWDKRIIPAAVFVIWIAQQAISVWLLSHGEAVRHEESFDHACTMFFHLTAFPPSLSAWIPLLFDTVVIGLVLYKCLPKIPEKRITMTRVYETLVKDGLMYYAVLFSVNFVLGVMIIVAQDAIKNITAQLEQLLTVAMISRITLSLMREGSHGLNNEKDSYARFHDEQKDDIEHIEYHDPGGHRQTEPSPHGARGDRGRSMWPAKHGIGGNRLDDSTTRLDHVSVVAGTPITRSYHMTNAGGLESMAESAATRVVPPRESRWYDSLGEHTSQSASSIVTVPAAATVAHSFGVISISPRHTEEALSYGYGYQGLGGYPIHSQQPNRS